MVARWRTIAATAYDSPLSAPRKQRAIEVMSPTEDRPVSAQIWDLSAISGRNGRLDNRARSGNPRIFGCSLSGRCCAKPTTADFRAVLSVSADFARSPSSKNNDSRRSDASLRCAPCKLIVAFRRLAPGTSVDADQRISRAGGNGLHFGDRDADGSPRTNAGHAE